MPDYAVNIILRGVDEATPVIRKVISESKKIRTVRGRGAGGAGVVSEAVVEPGGGGRLRSRRGDERDMLTRFGERSGRAADRLASASADVGRMGEMARSAVGTPLELAMDFEKSIKMVNALSGGSLAATGELEEVRRVSREMATEIGGFTAKQVADGFGILTQAGLKTSDQLENIRHVLDFATAGEVEMADAAQFLVDAVGGFNLPFSDTERVGNAMARAAMASQINLRDMGEAFKYSAPLAADLGISVEQTSTAIALLGKAGVKGSMAGTGLRSFFNRISNPRTDSQKAILKHLGIGKKELRAAIDSQDLPRVLQLWADGFARKGITGSKRLAVLQSFFQERGGLAADLLIKSVEAADDAANSWETFSGAVNDSTKSLGKMAAMAREGTHGEVSKLKRSLEDLGITVGDKLGPALSPVIADLTATAAKVAEWADENPDLVRGLGQVMLGVAATGAVLSPLLLGVSSVIRLVSLGAGAMRVFGLATGYGGLAMVKLGQAAHTVGPTVGSMIGSTSGKLGILGAAAGAALAGYEFGRWADETWGLSDAMAGLNHMTSTQIDLQQGLARVRGAALLGDMTEDERKSYDAAQEKRAQLFEEREGADVRDMERMMNPITGIGDMLGVTGHRSAEDIEGDIAAQDRIIDRINVTASERGEQTRRGGGIVGEAEANPKIGGRSAELDALDSQFSKMLEAAHAMEKARAKVEIVVSADGKAKVKNMESAGTELVVEQGIVPGGL